MLLKSFLSVISVSGGKLFCAISSKTFLFREVCCGINKSLGCSAGARDTAQIQLQPVREEGAATACSFSFFIVAKMDSFCNQ